MIFDIEVTMSAREIVEGLESYRAIAKQDMLRAPMSTRPDLHQCQAEVRRDVYGELQQLALDCTPNELVQKALEHYQELLLAPKVQEERCAEARAQAQALENFFVLVGLDPDIQVQARNLRPRLMTGPTVVS